MYTDRILATDSVHENCRARVRPRATSMSRSGWSVTIRTIARASASTSYGSTSSAASPATSGSDETFEVMTGVPQAIASSRGEPEPLVQRRKHERPGQAVKRRQRFLWLKAQEAHMLVELVTVHHLAQRGVLGHLVADDHQLQSRRAIHAGPAEGIDRPLDVLVRLDIAYIQHERVIELIPLPDPLRGGLVGRREEPPVDGVVDHLHLVGGDGEEAAGCRASTPPRR